MSDCMNGELRDLLPELMHGTLDAGMQRTVEAHVAACPTCAEELALLRSLRTTLARGPQVDVQRIAAAVHARTTRAPRRTPWRIALAAAALLAASGIGYAVLTRGHSSAPELAVVHTHDSSTRDSTHRAAPAPTPRQEVAVAMPRAASPRSPSAAMIANGGVLGNLSDLSDDDVRTLTASLDKLSGIPDADPSPEIDPIGASLDDSSAGGS
jgi:uncharacterized NAD-dependent epimerase/dehydratase family protein